jgi:phasin family protein
MANDNQDFTGMLAQFKLPGIDMNSLIEARRADIEALTEANKVAYDGMQELVRKQAEILRATMQEMQTAASELAKGQKPAAFAGEPKELVEKAVQDALANMREMAEVAVKTQTEALGIISRRAMQNVEEMKERMRTG